jgi:hypothetical protein
MRIGKGKSNDFLKEYVRTKTEQKTIRLKHRLFKSAKLMNKIIRKTNNLKRKAQAFKAHTTCV